MQLLIDEHLTPRICEWCLERRNPPLHAAHVTHRHLGATDDHVIFQYAWEHDLVVVTTNARDFLPLLNVELHPGLIVIREGGLLRAPPNIRGHYRPSNCPGVRGLLHEDLNEISTPPQTSDLLQPRQWGHPTVGVPSCESLASDLRDSSLAWPSLG